MEKGSAEEEFRKLLRKYEKRLAADFGLTKDGVLRTALLPSREYIEFKREYLPKHHSVYERLCNFSEKIIRIKPSAKREESLKESIAISHLNITPAGVLSASVITGFLVLMGGMLFSLLVGSMFFMAFFVFTALFIIIALEKAPGTMANNWRLKASNQMVLCIFYVVTYMRHTSNLEHAVAFAAEHLRPPLALDMKRVLWDVETEKFASIKESLDTYLETWRKWNMEFIESFHLIEASLYESSEDRRLNLIEKALEVMLEETYEKMLHYAHNLKSPITMLHMLGIILPILGLVILPLVVNFIGGVLWYHIAVLYNIILPFIVFYMGKNILSERPTGYGEVDVAEENPELRKYRNIIIKIGPLEIKINPIWFSIILFSVLFLVGISPILLHIADPSIGTCFSKEDCNDIVFLGGLQFLEYRKSIEYVDKIVGPFGIGAGVLSIAITLAFGLGVGMYYKLSSKNVIKIREKSKQLEKEFASALFQLGNRIGDGIPVEIAFGKVSQIMENTRSGEFFQLVSSNITTLGQNMDEAIFNRRTGALVYFPSAIIESSMKVLIVSAKKGPMIASQAVINVSRYIKEIHKVDERLKDLLADIIASMKSQISFLAPAIAGVVIGITSMVTTIMGQLGTQMAGLQQQPIAGGGVGDTGVSLMGVFADGIPTFYFQIIVGLYVVQIIYVLTILVNGIENGSDQLMERYLLGANLVKSTILYSILAFLVIVIFNIVAAEVIGGMQGMMPA